MPGMSSSLRTAIAKRVAPAELKKLKALELENADLKGQLKQEPRELLHTVEAAFSEAAIIAKLSKNEIRDILLALVPDPNGTVGRSGPLLIKTPFESEAELREEMQKLVDQLTEANKRIEDLTGRCAYLESSSTAGFVERLTGRLSKAEATISAQNAELETLRVQIMELRHEG